MSGQLYVQRYLQGISTRYALGNKLGRLQSRSGRKEKSLPFLYRELNSDRSGRRPDTVLTELLQQVQISLREKWPVKQFKVNETHTCTCHMSSFMKISQALQKAGSTGWTIGVLGFDSRRGLGILLFTTAHRTALGPTQPPIQWIPGFFPGGKAAGAWSWPLTSN
jgi:hypothetical protein